MYAIFDILHTIFAILNAIFYRENRANRVQRDKRDFQDFTQKTAYVKITPWRDRP